MSSTTLGEAWRSLCGAIGIDPVAAVEGMTAADCGPFASSPPFYTRPDKEIAGNAELKFFVLDAFNWYRSPHGSIFWNDWYHEIDRNNLVVDDLFNGRFKAVVRKAKASKL